MVVLMSLPLFLVCLVVLRQGVGSELGPWWIIEPWSILHISNGTGGQIDCKAGGEPIPQVSWRFADGKPLRAPSSIVRSLENGTLKFMPFHPSAYRHDIHAATYRCYAHNSAGAIVSRDVKVKAVVLQILELEVKAAKSYYRGSTAVLTCTVSNFMKEFISITSWLQDSSFNIYPSLKGDSKYHMLPSGELLVRRVDDADVYRSYQCRAVNKLTGQTILSHQRLRFLVTDSLVNVAPRINETPATVKAKKDQTVVLPCFAQGNPPPQYRWRRGTSPSAESEVRVGGRVASLGEALVIERVELIDSGLWTCIANNSAGSQKETINLHVSVPLTASLSPGGQIIVDVGEEFELSCNVVGGQSPSIVWLKDANPIVLSSSTGEDSKFTIAKVGRDDAGMYQCLVRDEEDSIQSSVQLILGASKPQFLYKFIQQTVQPGPAISLKCIATGNPTPQITWTLDGFNLIQNERLFIGQYVTLHGDVISHVNITNVQVQDGGIYQCKARNKAGEIAHSAEMRVYGLPFIRPMPNVSAVAGEPLFLPCPIAGYPIDVVSWEKDGKKLPFNRKQRIFPNGTLFISNVEREQDRGSYRCFAQNKQGKAASIPTLLTVIVPPKIAPFVLQSDLHKGDRVGVQCFVTKGDQPLHLGWELNGGELPSDVSVRQYGHYTSSLSINSLTENHKGNYTCVARNNAAVARYTAQLLVNVPPKLGPFAFGELVEGVRTQVQCVVQAGDPPLTLRWLKNGKKISSEQGIHISTDDYSSTLAIERVESQHAGDYTCVAMNPAKSTKLSSKLIVSVPPKWIVEPKDMNVTKDGVARFDCVTEGFPTPQTVWKKVVGHNPMEYQDLTSGQQGVYVNYNGTLIIKPALLEHKGQYLCETSNGIGSGLSAAVNLNINSPPEFESTSGHENVRRGQAQVLSCEAIGDPPISVTWSKHPSTQLSSRYEVREKQTKNGLRSELVIENSAKSDGGQYTCSATNPYGMAQRNVFLQVQDAPAKPLEVRVIDISSRSMKVSWQSPQDEQFSILQYTVQYKRESGRVMEEWESVNVGNENQSVISHLHPASVYSIRVLAENQLGAGEPSDIIQVTTAIEAPSGEPQGLTVTSTSSTELTVSWLPPPAHTHNGELMGYYIGIREYNDNIPASNFNFTTANALPNGASIQIKDLRPYTKYGIVAQAFNHKGSGPLSSEFTTHTLEDVPSAPPIGIQCVAQSSQSVLISWKPLAVAHQNGRIQGYRVHYENKDENPPGHVESDTKLATESSITLHGLEKYSNYSVQVWAFTKVGDGVKSKIVHCTTDEDVPDAPAHIKVLSTSLSSLTVSWLEPVKKNGDITGYTVYWRILEGGKERDPEKKTIASSQTHCQITHLSKSGTYELWVTASTRIGEGPSTNVVYATPSNRGSAGIISFGGEISVFIGGSITLPCQVRGQPPPLRHWTPKTLPHGAQLLPNGSVHITNAKKMHQRNYTCTAFNPPGSDEITYSLRVISPPETPSLGVTGNGPDWIDLHWTVADNGGSAIRGYILEFASVSNFQTLLWNEMKLSREVSSFKLTSLTCGTQYNLKICAFNAAGTGPPSRVVTSQTEGGKPIKPSFNDFLQGNTSTVSLYLNKWNSNGCTIIGFDIEYKEVNHIDWLTVGKSIKGNEKFDIVGLWPGRRYTVRVKATSSAGEAIGEYAFTTLHNLGVTLSPTSVKILSEDHPTYLEPSIILPAVASLLTLVSIGAAITICVQRRRDISHDGCSSGRRQQRDSQSGIHLDNKCNIAQQEQYYAAVQKGISTPLHDQCDSVPGKYIECAEDISPYATFHVATQQISTPHHIHGFIYHDQALAAMETMPLKSANLKDDYTKLSGRSKGTKCSSVGSDYSGSTTDQWSETGVMCRPERIPLHMYGPDANQLGDSSSSGDHSPVHERRMAPRQKHNLRRLDPPSGFSDKNDGESGHKNKSKLKDLRSKRDRRSRFTIAV